MLVVLGNDKTFLCEILDVLYPLRLKALNDEVLKKKSEDNTKNHLTFTDQETASCSKTKRNAKLKCTDRKNITIRMLSIRFVTEKLTSFFLKNVLPRKRQSRRDTGGKTDGDERKTRLRRKAKSRKPTNPPKTSGGYGNHCSGKRDFKKSKEILTFP